MRFGYLDLLKFVFIINPSCIGFTLAYSVSKLSRVRIDVYALAKRWLYYLVLGIGLNVLNFSRETAIVLYNNI